MSLGWIQILYLQHGHTEEMESSGPIEQNCAFGGPIAQNCA
jgi:hypothetical protein